MNGRRFVCGILRFVYVRFYSVLTLISAKKNSVMFGWLPLNPPSQMNLNPRHTQLLDEVRAHGPQTIEALAERFGVTLQTVRRDVQRMAEAGFLSRFHGGVRLPGSTTENIAYRQRQAMQADAKTRIARAVARRVPHGCSLSMNIGTTIEAVARELQHHRGLRVITNNLHIASLMSTHPDCEVIVAGGVVRGADQFKVDIGLIGISGIEADGTLRDFDYREVKVARAIVEQSREVWLAADHSKFNRPAMVELARLDDLDVVFTDQPPPPPFSDLLAAGNVECVLAGSDADHH